MCNWRAWLLPGLLTLAIITALAMLVRGESIEADLTARSALLLQSGGTPWASATLDGRDATLTGTAPTLNARDAAIASANRVFGVYRVDASALDVLPLADPYALSMALTADAVTVTGHFPDGTTRAGLLDDVRAVIGSRTLVDESTLARGAPANLADIVAFAIPAIPALVSGDITFDGTALSITGDAATLDTYDSETARLAAPAAGIALGTVAINPPIVSPYTWQAQEAGTGVTLSGFVPSEAARAALLAAAAPLGTVTDAMQLGAGEPVGFTDAAVALLGQMAGLDNASASITDIDLQIAGEAPDSAAYDSANAFLGTLPTGFDSLSGRIAPPLADPFVTMLARTAEGFALSGVLPDETARAVILEALGTADVTDTATVARGATPGVAVGDVLASVARTLSDLSEGQASLAGGLLTVSGISTSFAGADAAEGALTGLAGGALAVEADIVPGPASPFVFEAAAGTGGLLLEGFVPSEDVRTAILDDAAALFPTLALTDRLNVAEGAPEGFSAMVAAGLRALGRLDDGLLSIRDAVASLTGKALYARSVEQIEAGLAVAAPGAFTFSTEIDLLPPPPVIDATACQLQFARLLADNTIRFQTGSAAINALSDGLLDRLVRTLQSCPDATVEIGGHTDSQGPDETNLALSQERARAVVDYVIAAGIVPERVSAVGYGESDPVADNETEEGRALNRRIEFTVAR